MDADSPLVTPRWWLPRGRGHVSPHCCATAQAVHTPLGYPLAQVDAW